MNLIMIAQNKKTNDAIVDAFRIRFHRGSYYMKS